MQPEVTRTGLVSMQACVPKDWTDEQVEQFANTENPTGIESKWSIRRQGNPLLADCDERVQCVERESCCHVMLDC